MVRLSIEVGLIGFKVSISFARSSVKSELNLSGCGKDAGAVRRLQRLQTARCCAPDLRQIAGLQVNVIEEVGNVTLRHDQRGAAFRRAFGRALRFASHRRLEAGLLGCESADYLRLAIVEELKVFLLQVSHRVTLTIAYHGADFDQVHSYLECGRGIFGRDLRRFLAGRSARRSARRSCGWLRSRRLGLFGAGGLRRNRGLLSCPDSAT